MDPFTAAAVFITCGILYKLYKLFFTISLRDLPGPEPESFLLGNLRQAFQTNVGEIDAKWQEQFGGIARINGCFGGDRLWISDPKALQYMLHTSGYNFPKQPERRVLTRLISDEGLIWAEGDAHKRQKKVMMPAFGAAEAKALMPVFSRNAAAITQKWKDILEETPNESADINVAVWLSSATLDTIGEAGFDYKFGCLDNNDNELLRGYRKIMTHGAPPPSASKILFMEISRYIPMWITNFIYDHFPATGLQVLRQNQAVAHKVARELIASQSDTGVVTKGYSKDVMSTLIRANRSLSSVNRLTDDELMAQMRTILLAGHETTGNTLTWALMELANNAGVQNHLRSEIFSVQAAIQARGDGEFSASDFESMPYLTAFVKEVLRVYPVSYHNHRQAAYDDVLPLSKPIRLNSGRVVSEIPISKGTRVLLSITGYNMNKDVWGEDAHVFNPERWLREDSVKPSSNVGVYSNLLTFSGGARGCLGWRFALYELQAFIVELLANFEFSRTPKLDRLHRVACLAMTPVIDGNLSEGVQMPLRVSLVSRDARV